GGVFAGRSSTCRTLSVTHRRAYPRTNLDCARAASDIRESSTELLPRTPCHSAPPARSLQGGGYATVVLLPTPCPWRVVQHGCAVSPWFLQTAQGPQAWRFHPLGRSCPTHCTGPASSTRRHPEKGPTIRGMSARPTTGLRERGSRGSHAKGRGGSR